MDTRSFSQRCAYLAFLAALIVTPWREVTAAEGTQLEGYAGALFSEQFHYNSSDTSGPTFFGQTSIALGLSYTWIFTATSLGVDFFGTIPHSIGNGASSYDLSLAVPWTYSLLEGADVRLALVLGAGMMMKNVYASGGTYTDEAGAGPFYQPSGHSMTFAPDAVAGIFGQMGSLTLRLYTYILVPLSNSRRQFSTLITLGYVL